MKKQIILLIVTIALLIFQTGCKSVDIAISERTESPDATATSDGQCAQEDNELSNTDNKTSNHKTEYTLSVDEIGDDEFISVKTYIPDIVIDLKYATTDNFTGLKIYDFSDAYLRFGTVKKLAEVQKDLRASGLGLKIWDAFRPFSSQFRLWEICPDATYVANPNTGFSSHSRGNTVDVTLVSTDGNEVQMPTGFDDFSLLADRDYSDCDTVAAENAEILENVMLNHGFRGYSGEWWHYSDTVSYEVEREFYPPDSCFSDGVSCPEK